MGSASRAAASAARVWMPERNPADDRVSGIVEDGTERKRDGRARGESRRARGKQTGSLTECRVKSHSDGEKPHYMVVLCARQGTSAVTAGLEP